MIPSPYADQPQYGAPFSAKGKAAHTPSETPLLPHLPAFTVLPAHANDVNQRALAQSRRHMATQTKAQVTKDIVRDDVQRVGDVNITPEKHRSEARVIAEEQDLNVAGILVDVFKEQHAISTAPAFGNISGNAGVETKASANRKYSRKCPVTTCEYHRKEFLVKVEGDKHIMSHFEGDIKCGCYKCRVFGRKVFNDLEQLRSHVWECLWEYRNCFFKGFTCWMCSCLVDELDYWEHLKDHIVHTVELEASGRARACPIPSCSHHQRDFPSKHQREQHTLQHYSGSLACSWCYDSPWCRQPEIRYGAEGFRSHVSKKHLLDLSRIPCPVCYQFRLNGKELLEHFDSCVTLRVESGVHGGRIW